MLFTAKLEDQITPAADAGAGGLDRMKGAAKGADLQLRALGAQQDKAANRAIAAGKAFNPNAFKKQVLAERELAAAKDKALQSLGLGLSKKEQEEKTAAKNAEAEKKRQKELSKSAAGSGIEGLTARAKLLTLALGGIAGASGVLGLGHIAIGYMGMFRLQTITQRAGLNFRMLFKGVDSKPLERALVRITDMFSGQRLTGKTLGDTLTRTFNNVFRLIEKGEPYVTAFADGLLNAGLRGENAWLRARIALLPLTTAIATATGKVDVLNVVARGTALAVGLLGARMLFASGVMVGRFAVGLVTSSLGMLKFAASATVAAAPFLALAAAIGAVVVAADQFNKLRKEWDTDVLLRSIGIGESDADRLNRKFDQEAAERKKAGKVSRVREVGSLAELPPPPPPASIAAPPEDAKAKGILTGKAVADGLLVGMKSKEADVAKGGAALARAADAGVRTAADIHSPSKLMRREARYMGEGVEGGLKDSAPRVQRMASETLVPRLALGPAEPPTLEPRLAPVGAPTARQAPAGFRGFVLNVQSLTVGGGKRDEIQEDFRSAAQELFQQVKIAMALGAQA